MQNRARPGHDPSAVIGLTKIGLNNFRIFICRFEFLDRLWAVGDQAKLVLRVTVQVRDDVGALLAAR